MADPTTDTGGNPIPPADPSTPFSFTRTTVPTFCDTCGCELVTGDQVVGNGQAGTPYRHAACNAFGFRAPDAPWGADDPHTRS
jgi:hypothetical protein